MNVRLRTLRYIGNIGNMCHEVQQVSLEKNDVWKRILSFWGNKEHFFSEATCETSGGLLLGFCQTFLSKSWSFGQPSPIFLHFAP